MRPTVALVRDITIAFVGLLLVSLLVGSESWIPLILAVLVNAGWVATMRRGSWRWSSAAESLAFIANGAFLVWRFDETRVWLAVAAVWMLVVAADMSRLHRRYPVGSPPLYQRRVFRNHAILLGLIGAASVVVVALSLSLTIEPTLLAILLLVAFVVVGITRSVVETVDPPASEEQ